MSFNWIDVIILAVAAYHVWDGWELGLVQLTTNLVSFLGSLWLAIRYHSVVGAFLEDKFGIPGLWSTVLGYIAVASLSETLIAHGLNLITSRLPRKYTDLKMNRALGAVLSVVNSCVIMAFVLLVLLALPIRGSAKTDVKNSYFGSRLVYLAETYGGQLKSSLDQVTAEAVRFLTVKPSSDERVDLKLDPTKLHFQVNTQAEQKMVELVNEERAKVGAKALRVDPKIIPVARAHSKDMFERSYFAHMSPEGHDVAYRLEQGNVAYTIAGENLAYAPDVQTAHSGLMNSEGHKKNILEPRFGRIGIGVIDAGAYGMMFTQVFAD